MYDKLIELFKERNSKINLSSFNDYDSIKLKHIDDSLVGKKIIENLKLPTNATFVDVGTGSGFPVLPLAIEFPNYNFTGIESVGKKVKAVSSIISDLKLKNIEIIRERSENYKSKKYDVLLARAVSYIDKLLKNTIHLVKKGGYFVLYKLDSDEEFLDIQKNCKKYKLSLELKHLYKLHEDNVSRIIYVIKKI